MAITSYDSLIAALTAGKAQTRYVAKASTGITLAANSPYSLWMQAGMPEAGVAGAGAAGTWTAQDSSTVGALNFAKPTAPDLQHLITLAMAATAASAGTLMVYDRLGQIESLSVATGAPTVAVTSDFTARLGSGKGAQVFAEVTSVGITTTPPTYTLTYTNQAGTGSRTSQVVTGAVQTTGAKGRILTANQWFVPLANGDTGIRSVQQFIPGTLAAAGTVQLVAARPIAFLPMNSAGVHVERDLVLATPEIPRIFDDACLAFAVLPASTTAQNFNGYLKTVSG